MIRSVNRLLLLILFGLFLTHQANAGWVIEDSAGNVTFISDGISKDTSQGDAMWTLFDVEKNKITFINPAKEVYWQSTIDDFCKTMQRMTGLMRAMEAKRGGEAGPPRVKIKKVGNGGVIADHKTTKYKIMANGKLHSEVWLAEGISLVKELEKYGDTFNKLQACSGDGLVELSKEYMSLHKKGWPMKTVRHEFGSVMVEDEVVSLEEKEIPASEFTIPSRLSRADSFFEVAQGSDKSQDDIIFGGNDSSFSSDEEDYVDDDAMAGEASAEDNIIVQDTKEIASDVADEAHESTKDGIKEGVSEKLQKGIGGFMDKMFGR